MKKRIGLVCVFLSAIFTLHAQSMIDEYMDSSIYEGKQELKTKTEALITATLNKIRSGDPYAWADVTVMQHFAGLNYITMQVADNAVKVVLMIPMYKQNSEFIIEYDAKDSKTLNRLVTNISAALGWGDVVKYIETFTTDIGNDDSDKAVHRKDTYKTGYRKVIKGK